MTFTIIVCTKNSEKYLAKCLASLAAQTYKNFEVVLIDGNSTDKTSRIIESFNSKLIIRVYKQTPKGISAAMNFGIKKARGEWILVLHSDDSLTDKQVLADCAKFLVQARLDWFWGQINLVTSKDIVWGTFPQRPLFKMGPYWLLKYFNFVPHQSCFVHRRVFQKFGFFDETLVSGMDYDLWFRIYKKTHHAFFSRVVANFRTHAGSQSSSKKNTDENLAAVKGVRGRYLGVIDLQLANLFEQVGKLVNPVYKRSGQ